MSAAGLYLNKLGFDLQQQSVCYPCIWQVTDPQEGDSVSNHRITILMLSKYSLTSTFISDAQKRSAGDQTAGTWISYWRVQPSL